MRKEIKPTKDLTQNEFKAIMKARAVFVAQNPFPYGPYPAVVPSIIRTYADGSNYEFEWATPKEIVEKTSNEEFQSLGMTPVHIAALKAAVELEEKGVSFGVCESSGVFRFANAECKQKALDTREEVEPVIKAIIASAIKDVSALDELTETLFNKRTLADPPEIPTTVHVYSEENSGEVDENGDPVILDIYEDELASNWGF